MGKVLWKCKAFAALLVLLLSRTANKLVSNTLFRGLFTNENSAGVKMQSYKGAWSVMISCAETTLHSGNPVSYNTPD